MFIDWQGVSHLFNVSQYLIWHSSYAITSLVTVSLFIISYDCFICLSKLSVLLDMLIYAGFYFCIGRHRFLRSFMKCPDPIVYTNSILASLNAHKILRCRNSLEDFESTSVSLPVEFNVHWAQSRSRYALTDVSVPSLPDSTGTVSAITTGDLDSSVCIFLLCMDDNGWL